MEAEEVGGDGGGDAHSGLDIGGVDLGGGHLFFPVYLHNLQLAVLPVALEHHRQLLLGDPALLFVLEQQHASGAQKAAQKGAAQSQGNDFHAPGLLLGLAPGRLIRGIAPGFIVLFIILVHSRSS